MTLNAKNASIVETDLDTMALGTQIAVSEGEFQFGGKLTNQYHPTRIGLSPCHASLNLGNGDFEVNQCTFLAYFTNFNSKFLFAIQNTLFLRLYVEIW